MPVSQDSASLLVWLYKSPPPPLPNPAAWPHSLTGVLSLVSYLWFKFCFWENQPHDNPQVANIQLTLCSSDHVPSTLWRAGWQPLAVSLCDFHLSYTPLALFFLLFKQTPARSMTKTLTIAMVPCHSSERLPSLKLWDPYVGTFSF